jgi:hypothetical protein
MPASSTAARYIVLGLLLVVLVSATGCAAVAGIFKAGMWVGVIVAVLVIGGIALLVSRIG